MVLCKGEWALLGVWHLLTTTVCQEHLSTNYQPTVSRYVKGLQDKGIESILVDNTTICHMLGDYWSYLAKTPPTF